MEVEKTPQQIEDERVETVLLYVVADSFGREKFRARHKAILALMKLRAKLKLSQEKFSLVLKHSVYCVKSK